MGGVGSGPVNRQNKWSVEEFAFLADLSPNNFIKYYLKPIRKMMKIRRNRVRFMSDL